ncbi:MAG: hypothetical protein ABI434_21790, partial [Burkholderiaceae bacterium]
MTNHRQRLLPLLLGATLLLGACGGGGGGGGAVAPDPAQPDFGQSVTALIDYMKRLIAGTDENADQVNVNALTLPVDDTAEPTPL